MKKQLIAFGLASMLTVPTWLAAAQPMDVSAKKKVTVSKKTKAVISKIKALNSKKSNYVKNTLAAQTAYKKLSKTERKKVSNYKTLQKHMKAVQPMVNQVNSLKKEAAKLSSKNYKTQAAKVSVQYNKLKKSAKEYVPASVKKKITYYNNLNSANVSMRKLNKLALGDDFSKIDSSKTQDVLAFLKAYNQLSANQKLILGGSQAMIDYLLSIQSIVQQASNYDAQYEKLDPTNKSYLKQAYDLYGKYQTEQNNSVTVNGVVKKVSDFTKQHDKLNTLDKKIGIEVNLKKDFEDAVNALPGQISPGETKRLELVREAVKYYKLITSTTYEGNKLKGKPIDIVDKKVLAEYKKYETIPSVFEGFKEAPLYDSTNVLSEKQIIGIDTTIKNYAKLGTDQKEIVDEAVGTTQKKYVNDSAAIKKGQAMTKAFNDGIAKNDLAAVMKQFDVYKKAAQENDRSIRYVSASDLLSVAPVTYKTQLDNVGEFEKEAGKYASKADIQKLVTLYQTIEKDKPSGLKMIDAKVAKDYTLAKSVLEIDTLMAKSKPSYTTAKLNNILAATKLYSKLDASKKLIVDGLGHNVEGFAEDESAIKQAMAVDKKYLALKKSSKTYTKDARSVYNSYDDLNDIAKQYVINATKINALKSVFQTSQDVANAFEKNVYEVYKEVYTDALVNKTTIAGIIDIINTYENQIKPYPKYNNLVDPEAIKRYKQLKPIVDVYNQIFNLKATPTTELQRENILTAKKAFNKLDNFGKKVIQLEDKVQTKLRLLDDEQPIIEAKKIDAKYKNLRRDDTNYAKKVYAIYEEYMNAPDNVKNYVLSKVTLANLAKQYQNAYDLAKGFETAVNTIGTKSAIIHVHQLKKMYDKNKKGYPEFVQFIDPEVMKKYNLYLQLLDVQEVAQIVFNQQKINGNWVNYSDWFYSYSQTQDHRADVLNMRKVLLLFRDFTPIQFAILNNTPNYTGYEGILEHTQIETIPVYDPDTGEIIGTKPVLDYSSRFEKDEVIYFPGDWLNHTQVQNLLEAMQFEKRYQEITSGNKNNARELVKLYQELRAKPEAIQMYFLYNAELNEQFSKLEKPVQYADEFEAAVKAYNPNVDRVQDLQAMNTAYNKLDKAAMDILSATIIKKYKDYMLARDVYSLYQNIDPNLKVPNNGGTEATRPQAYLNVDYMEQFLINYTKLVSDSKNIVRNTVSDVTILNKILADEKDIRAAHAVDKKYQKLNPTSSTYEVDALKLYPEYAKLTDLAKKEYSVYGDILVALHNKYGDSLNFGNKEDNAKATADEFTRLVTALNADSLNADVKAVYDLYQFISVPQQYKDSAKKVVALNFVDKTTLRKYTQYEPIVTIKKELDRVTYPKTTKFTNTEKTAILSAIAAYKKLAKDPKNIVNQDPVFGNDDTTPENEKRYLLLIEEDIKKAEAADANFLKVKKGDKTFVKNIIVAMKSYNALTDLQKRFFTQTKLYTTYKKYDKADTIKGAVDTIPEAIKVIVDFESQIIAAQVTHDCIVQTPETAEQSDGCPMPSSGTLYDKIMEQIVAANKAYEFASRDFNIEGQVIRPSLLFDTKIVQRYKYFMSIYKVQQYLDSLKK